MPPDAAARLALRLEEARTADRGAREAARQLLRELQQGSNEDAIRFGFDRLEKEALELERKVLAARDELGPSVEAGEKSEIEALNKQAKMLRRFVAENRSMDTHVAARQLERSLERSAGR